MGTASGDEPWGQSRANVQHARLLVVTPDTQAADTLRTRLALAGYGVEWAPDAARALALMRAHAPDLILAAPVRQGGADKSRTDSGATGALVQALKAAAEGAYLPVLLLTSEGDGDDGAASGADDLLEASASDTHLRLRVRTLLHLGRRHQALTDSVLEMEATCADARRVAERYQAVFAQNMEAMLLVGGDGLIVEANGCACALTGYEPGALSGQPLGRLCPPELLWAGELAASGVVRPLSDLDASLVTAAGQIVPIEVRSAPIQPGKRADAQDAADALSDAASLYAVTLSDRRPERARLAQAQKAASAETAIVFSREINSPLFVIAGNVELLQSALVQQDSAVQAKLGRIADAARRLVEAAQRAASPPGPPPPGE